MSYFELYHICPHTCHLKQHTSNSNEVQKSGIEEQGRDKDTAGWTISSYGREADSPDLPVLDQSKGFITNILQCGDGT